MTTKSASRRPCSLRLPMMLRRFQTRLPLSSVPGRRALLGSLAGATLLMACGFGDPVLPTPRPVVIRSGARIPPDQKRLEEIDRWFRRQEQIIREDPTFLIEEVTRDTPAYPWESLYISGDTAKIGVESRKSPEAGMAYMIYAHFHLMRKMGRLEEFLPGASGMDEFTLEKEILSRVADVWYLGRSVYSATPYDPLEEILYAKENGFLEAFLLTARREQFAEERAAWLREDPEGLERYRRWFVATFSREPPGLRGT